MPSKRRPYGEDSIHFDPANKQRRIAGVTVIAREAGAVCGCPVRVSMGAVPLYAAKASRVGVAHVNAVMSQF